MIEVGEYVRTKTGRIYKLGYYNKEEKRWICVTDEDWFPVYESGIAKHSKNIIDLIEEGDYVNGKEVSINAKEYILFKNVGSVVYSETVLPEDIKSIVTKEMMKSVEYRVE